MAQTEDFILIEKRKALYKAYKRARKRLYEQNTPSGRIHTLAVLEAVKTPQKRFWLSLDRVYRILREMLKNGGSPATWSTRGELYKDLLTTYNRIKDLRMFRGKPLSFIADFVTYKPSRGFYMSASRAGRMIKEELDRVHKEKMKPKTDGGDEA